MKFFILYIIMSLYVAAQQSMDVSFDSGGNVKFLARNQDARVIFFDERLLHVSSSVRAWLIGPQLGEIPRPPPEPINLRDHSHRLSIPSGGSVSFDSGNVQNAFGSQVLADGLYLVLFSYKHEGIEFHISRVVRKANGFYEVVDGLIKEEVNPTSQP